MLSSSQDKERNVTTLLQHRKETVDRGRLLDGSNARHRAGGSATTDVPSNIPSEWGQMNSQQNFGERHPEEDCHENEKESIENQSSQEPPADVGIAMVEEMPTSIPSNKTSEDDLGSGSKEETVISKNTSAFEAENSSAMEGNGHAQTMEAEDTQQTSAISNAADVSDASISKAIDTTGENEDQREDEKPEPSKLEIAAMQGEDKCFDEALRFSLPDTKKTIPESETTDVARKIEGASDDILQMLQAHAQRMGGAMQNSEYDLKSKSSDEDMQAEEKDAQIATHVPAVMGLISEEIENKISPQASVHESTRSDLKGNADAYSHKLEKCSAVLNPSLQENGLDKATVYTLVCVKNSSTTIPKCMQPEQDANILHLPQKTMSTAENDMLGSKQEFNPKLPSGELFIASNESMVRNENEKISNQPSVSEMNNGFIQDISEVNEMETAANLQSASDTLQDINATLLHQKTDKSCNNAVMLETATGVTNTPKDRTVLEDGIQFEVSQMEYGVSQVLFGCSRVLG
eukprot:Gb_11059 [translate_table: standard]